MGLLEANRQIIIRGIQLAGDGPEEEIPGEVGGEGKNRLGAGQK